jgi:hypothetical protein
VTTVILDTPLTRDSSDLAWGAYAYTATHQICGRFSLATMRAADAFMSLLSRGHLHAQAAVVGLEQFMICSRAYGLTGDLTVHTGVQVGVHRLRARWCHDAHATVSAMLSIWRTAHPQPTMLTANLLIHLAAMARYCGQPAAASHYRHQVHGVARQLDSRYQSAIDMLMEGPYPLVRDHHLLCERPRLTVPPPPSLPRPPRTRRSPGRPAADTRPVSARG